MSLDIPHMQSVQQAIYAYQSIHDPNSFFEDTPPSVDIKFPTTKDCEAMEKIYQYVQSVDWESYFSLMDETLSDVLEIESKITRKFSEIHSLLSDQSF